MMFHSISLLRTRTALSFVSTITKHYQIGPALMHPIAVHYGFAKTVSTTRQAVLNKPYSDQPDRFANRPPDEMPPNSACIYKPNVYPESQETPTSGASLPQSEA